MRRAGKRRTITALLLGALAGSCIGGLVGVILVHESVLSANDGVRSPTVSSAEEFRLVDADGKVRGIFGLSSDRQPYLALIDEGETRRVWVGIAQESGVAVRDIDGKTRLVLSVDADGQPSLVVRDRRQQSRIFQP
ncbi:hypothetical protein [Candidatus Nitrospira bockiana]